MSTAVAVRPRLVELDRLRGLAILLMMVDHVAIVGNLPLVRVTLGRLAVPIFFVLAGHLAGRLTRRHLLGLGLGLALPLVSFVDQPNVLVWWALGCAVLVLFERLGWPLWALIVAGLTMAANGWSVLAGASYDPLMLLGLMALGRALPVGAFALGRGLPSWFAVLGVRPLAWYVGHVLALQLLLVGLGRG